MPHYFFDVSDHVYIRDEHGSDVADAASVRIKAVKVAIEAREVEAVIGGKPDELKVVVRDEDDHRVLTVSRNPNARR